MKLDYGIKVEYLEGNRWRKGQVGEFFDDRVRLILPKGGMKWVAVEDLREPQPAKDSRQKLSCPKCRGKAYTSRKMMLICGHCGARMKRDDGTFKPLWLD